MLPPNITVLKAEHFSSRQGQKIQAIIAHDTERPKDDSNSIEYLRNGGGRKVSIHVLIQENGDSYIMVNDTDAANHAGYGTLKINGRTYSPDASYSVNTCTLGFELEHTKDSKAPYPEAQLLSAGYWINTWRERWGYLPLFKHADIDPKRRSDPINLSVVMLESYAKRAKELLKKIPTPDNPIRYITRVPQVVYTARSINSRFAGTANAPIVLDQGVTVAIGDISNDWAWIATGIGFIPVSTIKEL